MQMKNNDESYLGQKYGRLTVIGFCKSKGKNRGWKWQVACNCGNIKIVNPRDVKNGKTRSCGCLHDEVCKERATKFNHLVVENKRLYGIYNGIKKRCYSQNEVRYKDYGARGIKMCEEWLDKERGFDNFADWAYENGYNETLTIERKDVNGDYCPENCEWITNSDQQRNKRDTLWVEYKGEKVKLVDLCEKARVSYDTLHDRIYKRGWDVERAVELGSSQESSLMSKCAKAGINYGTVRSRIKDLGWDEEKALNTPTLGRGAHKHSYKKP